MPARSAPIKKAFTPVMDFNQFVRNPIIFDIGVFRRKNMTSPTIKVATSGITNTAIIPLYE
ncbi:Uncharacterised protein [Mycobacteroides abscessus subsp. abscessus]|nr:Uncharacterised protein [Mycobacteroides abscessus subsp. abscessus]